MDKYSRRKKIINDIEENIQTLSETLGNFNRMSIYVPDKKFFVKNTEESIEYMLSLREKVINKPI